MAKTAGHVRASKWKGDIFTVNGTRKEYYELPEARKKAVQSLAGKVSAIVYKNVQDKSVNLNAGGKDITVQFTQGGIAHFTRDAMLTLSGKYMSHRSMINVDQLLSVSEYVPTSHALYKGRKDGKELFFRYKDKTGRGIFFKIAYEPKQGEGKPYYLYAVGDIG
jgi:hypothetical protein